MARNRSIVFGAANFRFVVGLAYLQLWYNVKRKIVKFRVLTLSVLTINREMNILIYVRLAEAVNNVSYHNSHLQAVCSLRKLICVVL